MESLVRAIREHCFISKEEAAFLYSFFRKEKYRKNTLLLEEGHTAHEVYFVTKGGLRQYFFTEPEWRKPAILFLKINF